MGEVLRFDEDERWQPLGGIGRDCLKQLRSILVGDEGKGLGNIEEINKELRQVIEDQQAKADELDHGYTLRFKVPEIKSHHLSEVSITCVITLCRVNTNGEIGEVVDFFKMPIFL